MKQLYTLLQLTFLLTLLTGCDVSTLAISEEPKPEDLKRNEIGFNVANQNTKTDNTKANTRNGYTVEVQDMQNNKHTKGTILTSSSITDFGAFGYSTNDDNWTQEATPNIFYDLKVLKTNGWNSKEYWKDGKNSFFAYAPYKTETNGITITTNDQIAGAPTIKYVMATDATHQPDILVATPALNNIKPVGDNQGVPMTFKHKLAAIGFRAIEAYGSSISSITIKGIKTEGTLKIDNEIGTTWDTAGQTSVSDLNYTAGINSSAQGDDLGNIAEIDLMRTDGYFMVIPQTFTDKTVLTVNFTGGETTELVINLKDYIKTAEAGKQYICVLNLNLVKPPHITDDYSTKHSNCYVVKPGNALKFNAKIIGRVPTGLDGDAYNPHVIGQGSYGIRDGVNITINPKSVAVKWQTAHGRVEDTDPNKVMLIQKGGITYDPVTGDCIVKISNSTLSTPGGSAYLCAYSGENGSGTILWSWHIWVVKDDIATFNVNSFQMQDRALRAISTGIQSHNKQDVANQFGMHYQWGRKDPFTPAGVDDYEVQIYDATGRPIIKGTSRGEFKADNTTKTTINHLIQNPSIHYSRQVEPTYNKFYWVPILGAGGSSLKKDWWNPEFKTMYDPCPYGFRIPKAGAYDGISSLGFPYYGGTLHGLFIPHAGTRMTDDGSLWRSFIFSWYWMSTPYTHELAYHYKNMSDIIAKGPSHRANNYPVRCVKE